MPKPKGRPKKNPEKEQSNLCPNCKEGVMTREGDHLTCSKCHAWKPLKEETKAEKKARLEKELKALDEGEETKE